MALNFIGNLEKKIKLALTIALGSFIVSIIIVALGLTFAYRVASNSQNTVYVLSDNIPLQATKKDVKDNRFAEYKGTIDDFHKLFFNLTPDESYINEQIKQSIYLIDATGIAQYNTLKEKSFYSRLVQTNTIQSITTDSIAVDMANKRWVYYGKIKIDRPSNTLIRSLITEGSLQDVQRSERNPHGVMLTRWKTIENKDLQDVPKKAF